MSERCDKSILAIISLVVIGMCSLCSCWWMGDPDGFVRFSADRIHFETEVGLMDSVDVALGPGNTVTVQGLLREIVPECVWFDLVIRIQISRSHKDDLIEFDVEQVDVNVMSEIAELYAVNTVRYLTNSKQEAFDLVFRTDTCKLIDAVQSMPDTLTRKVRIYLGNSVAINGKTTLIDTIYAYK